MYAANAHQAEANRTGQIDAILMFVSVYAAIRMMSFFEAGATVGSRPNAGHPGGAPAGGSPRREGERNEQTSLDSCLAFDGSLERIGVYAGLLVGWWG